MEQIHLQRMQHLLAVLVLAIAGVFNAGGAVAQDVWAELQSADRVLGAGPVLVEPGGSAWAALLVPAVQGVRSNVYFVNGSGRVVAQTTSDQGGGGIFNNGGVVSFQTLAYQVTYDAEGQLVVMDTSGVEPMVHYRGTEPNGIIAILIGLIDTSGGTDTIDLRVAQGNLILQRPGSDALTYIKMEDRSR